MKDWKDIIQDPNERKVFEALEDKRFDYRTLDGLIKSSGLTNSDVREILIKYPDLVRKSLLKDSQDRELYTLVSKPVSFAQTLDNLKAFISKSSEKN